MTKTFAALLLTLLLSACITGPPPGGEPGVYTATVPPGGNTPAPTSTLDLSPAATGVIVATEAQPPANTATTPVEISPSASATTAPVATDTLQATATTATPIPTASAAPLPTPTRIPSLTTTPEDFNPIGLLNGSFEDGAYTIPTNGSSLIPNGWKVWFADESTPRIDKQDSDWLPPEILPKRFDTLGEGRALVPDGDWSLKAFKGWAPIWIRLTQTLALEAGTYEFSCQVFPDQVMTYDGGKQYPAPGVSADWYLGTEARVYSNLTATTPFADARTTSYGQWGTLTNRFTLERTQQITLTLELRGRWGFVNNGWFVDDCTLTTTANVEPTPTRQARNPDTTQCYTVAQGDSLARIAQRFDTSVTVLIAWNYVEHPTLRENPSLIEVGWQLCMPLTAPSI